MGAGAGEGVGCICSSVIAGTGLRFDMRPSSVMACSAGDCTTMWECSSAICDALSIIAIWSIIAICCCFMPFGAIGADICSFHIGGMPSWVIMLAGASCIGAGTGASVIAEGVMVALCMVAGVASAIIMAGAESVIVVVGATSVIIMVGAASAIIVMGVTSVIIITGAASAIMGATSAIMAEAGGMAPSPAVEAPDTIVDMALLAIVDVSDIVAVSAVMAAPSVTPGSMAMTLADNGFCNLPFFDKFFTSFAPRELNGFENLAQQPLQGWSGSNLWVWYPVF
ncbi:hypothetical protein OF83DRAFT_483026 [Amylostereum chailletii]|nr:hypothetical protein OF83DRAFT_483026 [Amylostereum chailletii]